MLAGTSEQYWVLSAAARISKALILGLLPFSDEGGPHVAFLSYSLGGEV